MFVILFTLPLLAASEWVPVFNKKCESTERMGLDVPLTRMLYFYISDNLCSGVVSTPLYDEDCQKPLAMEVIAQDNYTLEVTLQFGLEKATVIRKRNSKQECPGEAPVLVRMACPSHNGTRRFYRHSVPRALPVARDEDLIIHGRKKIL